LTLRVCASLLTILRADVWLRTDENADTADWVLHSSDPLLAPCSVGAGGLANSVADFVTIPAGVYARGSCVRIHTGAAVFTRPGARSESVLNAPRQEVFCDSLAQVSLRVIVRFKTNFSPELSLSKAK